MINHNIRLLAYTAALLLLYSCDKVPVTFGSDGTTADPNVMLIDTFTVNVSTLQVDSFSTSGATYLIAGSHNDPQLGIIEAKTYFEISPPVNDIAGCSNCVFDSLVFNTAVSTGYLGDTTAPFTLSLHELTQAMNEEDLSTGYNTSKVAYNHTALATGTFGIRPSVRDTIRLRLPDEFGKNIFRMMRYQSDTISNADKFKRYFKGICLAGNSSNNALYYLYKHSSGIIQLHYTVNGVRPEAKTAAFTISGGREFNAFTYNRTGTSIQGITPGKAMLVNSSLIGNTGYLHFNSGLFPKISFGNLSGIKELYPYVQVMRAELEIRPVKGSWGTGTPYSLPPYLELRQTDDNNTTTGSPLTITYGSSQYVQYGSLNIDNLYGENTAYTYDVTDFVNTLLTEGVFSRRALLLHPPLNAALQQDIRLLINNATVKDKPIKLKLYVLGL
ncbi:MAG TPA: DUF4270 family protein [Ferruginibacter sp.]|nr:DUF4270 family protein [Ferruginibacter sp.]HMP21513.1 DUF4270 family protein [Ferruginibacter sp.]